MSRNSICLIPCILTRYVTLTREERLIYRQICHEQGVYDVHQGYDHIGCDVRERILHCCASFDLSGETDSPIQAIYVLGEQVKKNMEDVKTQLNFEYWRACRMEYSRQFTFQLQTTAAAYPMILPHIRGMLESVPEFVPGAFELQRHSVGDERVSLKQPLKPATCYKNPRLIHSLTHRIAQLNKDKEACRLLEAMPIAEFASARPTGWLAALKNAATLLPQELDTATRNWKFYTAQVEGLKSSNFKEDCGICMQPLGDAGSVCLLPCAHFLHTECASRYIRQKSECPFCRRHTAMAQISIMKDELDAMSSHASEASTSELPGNQKHGSKLSAIATCLHKIREMDNLAQVIVYTQWVDLEKQVAVSLADHGIPCARMTTRANSGSVLANFQAGRGPWVLLLSLSQNADTSAASGLNITAASHVVFVHPMNANLRETAMAYEQQAIGRIRRIGQQKKRVHVWRFVTRGTVEEHIVNLHRLRGPTASTSGTSEEAR